MQAPGDLAHLFDHGSEVALQPFEPSDCGEPSSKRGAKGLDVERERNQPLLDAVVQIALDAPASLIAGTDDPRP